jgi:hypothetical protein
MSTAAITREEAIEVGLDRYWPGTPCDRGHLGEHYVLNSACVECNAGKLTPSQHAFIFGPSIGEGDSLRAGVTTWVEWEAVYMRWMMARELAAVEASQTAQAIRLQKGGTHGANHTFKVKSGDRRKGPPLHSRSKPVSAAL